MQTSNPTTVRIIVFGRKNTKFVFTERECVKFYIGISQELYIKWNRTHALNFEVFMTRRLVNKENAKILERE